MSIRKSMLYLAVALAAMITPACAPKVAHVSQRIATANMRNVNQSAILEMPQLVDLEIEDKLVSGSYSANDVTVDDAKVMAVANAIKMAKADVLIEPIYDITITDNNVSATVQGHPAHYKNFRKQPPVLRAGAKPANTSSLQSAQPVKQVEQAVAPAPSPVEEEKAGVEKEVEKMKQAVEKQEEEAYEVKRPPVQAPVEEEKEEKYPEAVQAADDDALQKPFHVISCSAVARESDASEQAQSLRAKGLKGDYLWIPDYDRAGKSLYKVYVGPYSTRSAADAALARVKTFISGAYVQTFK